MVKMSLSVVGRFNSGARSRLRPLRCTIAAALLGAFVGATDAGTSMFTTGAAAVNPCSTASSGVTVWTAASGDWDAAGNWSNGIPNAGKIACITKAGTYTVTVGFTGNEVAQSLELGGSSGTQALHVFGEPENHPGLLKLSNQDPSLGVETHGQILLAETHLDIHNVPQPTSGGLEVDAGTLTNRGTIVSQDVGSGGNELDGSFDNQGALQLNENTASFGTGTGRMTPAVWNNSGTITIAASKLFEMTWITAPGFSFTQTAGSIVNNGTYLQHGGAFLATGTGTTTGVPLQFDNIVTITPSGTGSGNFELRSGNDTLASDIAAGYTLRIAGRIQNHNGVLHIPVNRVNHGTIRLGSTDGTTGGLDIQAGATLTNAHSIIADVNNNGGVYNHINGNLDNEGLLQLDENTTSSVDSTWTTSGTISIAAGKTLKMTWTDASSFTQTAGSIVDSGNYVQTGGAFLATGTGTQTGNPLVFDNHTSISPSGTGTGSFEVRSGRDTLASDIGAGYTVRVAGVPENHQGNLAVAVNRTNNGVIVLGGRDSTNGAINVQGGLLTNKGSIVSDYTDLNQANNGANVLIGPIDNEGVIDAATTDIGGTGTVTNNGAINVGSGRTITLSALTQLAGGTLGVALGTAGPGTVSVAGNATLAGALHVTTTSPQAGTITVLTSPAVSGTFSPVTFTGQPYTVAYAANSVTLGSAGVGASYTALVPARLLETRPGPGFSTVDGQFLGADLQAGGSVTQLTVTGRAGVPADASAVVLNVTVTGPVASGYVTVFPCGSTQPTASNLNYVTGSTVPNAVITKVGDGGKVCLFTSQATQLIVDVNGYFPAIQPG